jgi:hypothetical protein
VLEAAVELRVAIVDEKAKRLFAVIDRHQQVASLLGHPHAVRVRHARDELDPAARAR